MQGSVGFDDANDSVATDACVGGGKAGTIKRSNGKVVSSRKFYCDASDRRPIMAARSGTRKNSIATTTKGRVGAAVSKLGLNAACCVQTCTGGRRKLDCNPIGRCSAGETPRPNSVSGPDGG